MKQNSTVKEQSLNPQPNVRPTAEAEASEGLDERVLAALHAASEKKALEPVVLDLREIASFTDYGDFVLHVFEQKARKFYDLERLWRESKRIDVPAEFNSDSAGSLRTEL